MSTREEMERGAKEFGANQGSNMFQFKKSGKYAIRLLTKPLALATHFFGQGQSSAVCFGIEKGCPFHTAEAGEKPKAPSVKFITYVVDREDGKVKLAELPWSVISAVADFEEDEDYKFENYPMPFDIKVTFDKENDTPAKMYKTMAVPKQVEVTAEERAQLEKAMAALTPEDYVAKRKAKSQEKNGKTIDGGSDMTRAAYPEEEAGDIPF